MAQPSLQERVPTYIRDTILQHRVKPSWYSQLAAASAVRVPVLTPDALAGEVELGAWVSTHSRLDKVMNEVCLIRGLFEGCTIPLEQLSIAAFRQLLGDFYDGSVQVVVGGPPFYG